MNECLELHKAMSEAEVEYQKKYDALKEFESLNFPPSVRGSLEAILEMWDELKKEEQVAYKNKEAAISAYMDCLKSQIKKR